MVGLADAGFNSAKAGVEARPRRIGLGGAAKRGLKREDLPDIRRFE